MVIIRYDAVIIKPCYLRFVTKIMQRKISTELDNLLIEATIDHLGDCEVSGCKAQIRWEDDREIRVTKSIELILEE